ncbi:MAG: hypothetical protein OEZ68_12755 [Gammaproteobacteria bacterium]|nr:hypothetical protein [Gammaproteobacteria bacterium]MDH5801667.1 hypothetical protein [Gammaproteobacteria bacterium]
MNRLGFAIELPSTLAHEFGLLGGAILFYSGKPGSPIEIEAQKKRLSGHAVFGTSKYPFGPGATDTGSTLLLTINRPTVAVSQMFATK